MPNVPLQPTWRGVLTGQALRRLRSEANLSLERAAAQLGWHASKLSRIENGRQHLVEEDVVPLLQTYGVDDPDVTEGFQRLARESTERRAGWWHGFADVLTPRYADLISLETEAENVRVYAPIVVPALLQTPAYARAVTAGVAPTRTPEQVAALVDVRQARQSVLTRRPDPLPYWVILEESVLHRSFGGTVMPDQLRRLIDMATRPNITVQIVPSSADPHPGFAGGFDLVTFAPPLPTRLVEIETLRGSSYVDDPEHARLWDAAWEGIRTAALPQQDSLALISQRLREES
jgi:transcriptional regulator with XRE-family HTH domain